MATDDTIRGLERELAGYDLRGKEDRAAQVRAELAKLRGTEPEPAQTPTPKKRATKRAARKG